MNSKYTQEQMAAIIDFMVAQGVDRKRLENPISLELNSSRFGERNLLTEASVAVLMVLQDPTKSIDGIIKDNFQPAKMNAMRLKKFKEPFRETCIEIADQVSKFCMSNGYDIAGIYELYQKAKSDEEVNAVKGLITNANRWEVASYIYSQNDGKAFDALVVVDRSRQHISHLQSFAETLNQISRNASKFKDSAGIVMSKNIDIMQCVMDGKVDYSTMRSLHKFAEQSNTMGVKNDMQMNHTERLSFLYVIPEIFSKVMAWLTTPSNEAMKKRFEKVFDDALGIKLVPVVSERAMETSVGKATDIHAPYTTPVGESHGDKQQER